MGPECRVRLVQLQANCRMRQVVLDDTVIRTTSRDVLVALDFDRHTDVDASILVQLIDEAEPEAAFRRALRILNCRERSSAEMMRRLLQDGYPDGVASATLSRLTRIGILDDSRFAASFARSRRRAGWARSRAARGLRDAGVDDQTAQYALAESYPPGADESIARDAISARPPVTRAEARRLHARLMRRGVPASLSARLVRDALRAAQDDTSEPPLP